MIRAAVDRHHPSPSVSADVVCGELDRHYSLGSDTAQYHPALPFFDSLRPCDKGRVAVAARHGEIGGSSEMRPGFG